MKKFLLLIYFAFLLFYRAEAQKSKKVSTPSTQTTSWSEDVFKNYKFRNIGPAFMSGRIADIAINPQNENIWYVAVGSGGVWKTENAGVTFNPIFDKQKSYSIGCVTIDPNNTNIIWVGTGENVGARHIGIGDGVFKSEDGGINWTNMGLTNSNHISKIDVYPGNSNIIRVASQGPLWYTGGDRGFFISQDGGRTWTKTLGDDKFTGVTDFVVDPRNPDLIYAATWQHHRTVAAYMGGGLETRIYKSEDGGKNWLKLKNGLPEGNMGKIGLAISPQNPDVVYAAIELDRRKGGVYRSENRGGDWKKMSNAVSGGTGPHYYQELYASPHKFDRLYLVDNWMQTSEDGGKTFSRLNKNDKHGDNHSVTFKKSDPNYLIVGTDGGVYESFDLGQNWRHIENLPVTQFYKVAVDDSKPFYNIFGGTQDNNTQGGPSRTDNLHGIRNADWKVVLDWDGHQPATEPGNPNIMYAERQQGNLARIDMTTGEVTDIQPQPNKGDSAERFNWDTPILVSPHKATTIYTASQRVWKSENRGDSWTAISGDLTRNQERITLPIMGKKQSWDAPWDVFAMSNYNSITSLAESPVKAGLLYAGTDDGILQITEDSGANWKKIEVSTIPGIPSTAFINDIKADLFDANTVYVAMDNHKYGDFKPYLVKSTDKGITWVSITDGLTQKNLIWRLVQDYVNKNLLFAGTESGVYFSVDGGKQWTKLSGGMPTISVRDLAIQRRENDLVAASFGRGFFVLDDFTALREVSTTTLQKEAVLFKPRDAWWYIPKSVLSFDDKRGSQGAEHFVAPNPDFGVVFTYYLKEDLNSAESNRIEKEKDLKKNNTDIPFPGWKEVEAEKLEIKPYLFIEIKNENGEIINRVKSKGTKGFNRLAWDLTHSSSDVVSLDTISKNNEDEKKPLLAMPGKYSATLYKFQNGKTSRLDEPVDFQVNRLYPGFLPADIEVTTKFWRAFETLSRDANVFGKSLKKELKTANSLHTAALRSNLDSKIMEEVASLEDRLNTLLSRHSGNQAKVEIGEKTEPILEDRIFAISKGITRSTYGPTETHKQMMKIALEELANLNTELTKLKNESDEIAKKIAVANGPVVED